MANPVLTALTADVWTKVATAVTSGTIRTSSTLPDFYLHTYKLTGEAAPANDNTAIRFDPSGYEEIGHSVAIDVYVKPVGAAGSVIVSV